MDMILKPLPWQAIPGEAFAQPRSATAPRGQRSGVAAAGVLQFICFLGRDAAVDLAIDQRATTGIFGVGPHGGGRWRAIGLWRHRHHPCHGLPVEFQDGCFWFHRQRQDELPDGIFLPVEADVLHSRFSLRGAMQLHEVHYTQINRSSKSFRFNSFRSVSFRDSMSSSQSACRRCNATRSDCVCAIALAVRTLGYVRTCTCPAQDSNLQPR
jgi:hypothetical protein